MRLFKLFLLLFIPTALFSQEVAKDFNEIIFSDDFSSSSAEIWPQTYNVDNLFVRQNGSFDLIRKNPELGYFVIPETDRSFSSFEMKAGFTLTNWNKKKSSAGVVVMADKGKSSGILVEVNQKREYKISRVFPDRMVNITKTKSGWVKNSTAISKTYNEVLIRTHNKVYDLYINQYYITSFSEIELSKGNLGLYIGPNSRASFNFIEVKGAEDNESHEQQITTEESEEDMALTLVIIKLKNDLSKRESEIEELKSKLDECGKRSNNQTTQNYTRDTALVNRNRELAFKNKDLETENEILKGELLKSKAESARLKKFKDEIESHESGDIVIELTNLISKQKVKAAELEARIQELEEIDSKNNRDLKMLSNKVTTQDNKIQELEDKNKELDSLRNEYREILLRFKIDPDNPVAPVLERDEGNNDESQDDEVIDEDYINKLIEKGKAERRATERSN